MNELYNKIEKIARGENYDGKSYPNIEAISKFFLEEIKEAWLAGHENAFLETSKKDNETLVEDYLKSKYNL